MKVIFNFIKDKNYKTIYDVGTDHGFLPINLVQNNYSGQIWATDINQKIITKLKKKVADYPQIHCLAMDGLKKINQKVDLVIIAGLGTGTILKILENDNPLIQEYALQTQNKPIIIRKWIQKQNFFLSQEKIIKENKYFYHYLFINKKTGVKIKDEQTTTFGPIMLKNKSREFKSFWLQEKKRKIAVLTQIKDNKKSKILTKEIQLIEEILKN